MIRFFKSTQTATLIIIPFLVMVLWMQTAFSIMPVKDLNSMPLWQPLHSFFSVFPSWFNYLFMVTMISLQAIYFNFILNRHEILYKNSFLPALMFALFVSSAPALMEFNAVHFANFIILRIFDRLFSLHKNELPVAPLFDIGFLAATASLIYFPALAIVPVLIVSISLIRSFKIKEILIIVTGFILPFFFVSVWMFWQHSLIAFWQNYLSNFTDIAFDLDIQLTTAQSVLLIFTGILLFISLAKLRLNFYKNVIRTRTYQQALMLFLIAGIAGLMITKQPDGIHFVTLLIPLAVFTAYLYVAAKKRMWLYDLSLYLLMAIIVWNQF